MRTYYFHDLTLFIICLGSVPSYYRDIFDLCSVSGAGVERDVFQTLLRLSGLESSHLERIWELSGPGRGPVTRSNVFKCLALMAWAQQGKDPSWKLLDNFAGQGTANLLFPSDALLSRGCTKVRDLFRQRSEQVARNRWTGAQEAEVKKK